MFGKILIANRGEIAVRVIRACRSLGIRSVAIYSEADRQALHVRLADEAHACGAARATESYLDVERVVGIARRAGVDAIHPGYGFLSENAAFAEAVEAAGIVLIGPSAEVIRTMGLKLPSRELMRRAGVPVVPGGEEIERFEDARITAAEMGYPVLVKASAGGGGRGMRRVEEEAGLAEALERARSEAESAFGNGSIYLEKYLDEPRHVEIQVLADRHGSIVHLGERECSIQRRHQKLLEEAPAFGMTEALRTEMGEAAVRAARAVGYEGAGTCEFLLAASGGFYFLEMNTRIQVEHPVTESVTGIDLVTTQIRIAAGEPLPFSQSDVSLQGHAIEARIYAEDPDRHFMPCPGPIEAWSPPGGPGIRLDSGFEGGQRVSSHYDPMIAKLIASGRDRDEALARLAGALEEFTIAGIRTGLPFLRRLVEHPVFRTGRYDTGFIEEHMSEGPAPLDDALRDGILAAVARTAAEALDSGAQESLGFEVSLPGEPSVPVEVVHGSASSAGSETGAEGIEVRVKGRPLDVEVVSSDGVLRTLRIGDTLMRLSLVEKKRGRYEIGLRDRVLASGVERLADPGAVSGDAPAD